MSNINVLGIDLAKNIFQVCAEDKHGNQLFNRRYKREKFMEFMSNLQPCLIGMEACGSAHYWGREFQSKGHEVKLINPAKARAYVERNKTDEKDAEGICEATKSKRVHAIAVKSLAQQNLTNLHRTRQSIVGRRTQVTNHLRSQLAEYGLITNRGLLNLRKLTLAILGGELLDLTAENLFAFQDLYDEWAHLDKRIKQYNQIIKKIAKDCSKSALIMELPGVGELTATAIQAKVGNFNQFKKGSAFSAWLGLTPKETSSAERRRLGRISKQGDRYIRTLLIHGARASIRITLKKDKRDTAYHRWMHQLVERVGYNKAAVALANKHARMIWAIMTHANEVDLNHAAQWAA